MANRQRGFGPGAHAAGGKKASNFKGTLLKLAIYCKKYLPAIIISLILAIVSSIITIIGPDRLSEITDIIADGLMTGIDLEAVVSIALTLAILYGVGAILSYGQNYIMATISQRVSKSLRSDISLKINRLPLKYFDRVSYGDVLSRVTNDIDTIGQTMNQSLGSLVSSAVLLVGSLVMMLRTNGLMTLAAVVATVIGFILMMLIMSKSQKYFSRQQKELGLINGLIEENYSGHNIVKAYNGAKSASEEFDKLNVRLENSNWKSQFTSGLMMPIMIFVGNFGYVAVCVTGAVLAINGTITFGVIVAFMIYVRLFTQPLSQIAQAATSLQSTAGASEHVFELLDEPELENEDNKTTVLETAIGDVEFRHVHFGYSEDKTVINDFSAHAKPGQKVAIVGPTGAGKTTMVNLLMRFYELNSGEILIDGVPTSELTRANVHSLFCMVLQDTWIFEGTIKDNIAYSKSDVTDEQVVQACKAVGLHHFIRSLPDGYNTVLDDKSSLSVGQKQLVTIARAMIENAPMLILDEATSSVDTRTEILIQNAMDKLMVGRTSFVIAHRLSTIRNADLILVMKDGDIVESGTHDELLEKGGFYAELYNSQFDEAS